MVSSGQAHQDEEVYVELPREARQEQDVVWKCLRPLVGLKGAADAWDVQSLHSVKELTAEHVVLTQAQSDGCVFSTWVMADSQGDTLTTS